MVNATYRIPPPPRPVANVTLNNWGASEARVARAFATFIGSQTDFYLGYNELNGATFYIRSTRAGQGNRRTTISVLEGGTPTFTNTLEKEATDQTDDIANKRMRYPVRDDEGSRAISSGFALKFDWQSLP